MCNFHGLKDNSIVLSNNGKNNERKRDVISIKYFRIQLREDGIKRGTVVWEEALFLLQKHPK